jgi:hypothetical protein
MSMNRREFIAASLAGAAALGSRPAFAAQAEHIQAIIDASKVGAPSSPMLFGG